jgi:uncharacterized paraquat-inducible protein A
MPVIAITVWIIGAYMESMPDLFSTNIYYSVLNSGFFNLIAGLYLFFGGKWIVNKAIPSNRPYCHECGYELTHARSNVCPECGTEFKPSKPPIMNNETNTEHQM